jgi:DNA-directed RNA polymerase specialized sigma24 family protein
MEASITHMRDARPRGPDTGPAARPSDGSRRAQVADLDAAWPEVRPVLVRLARSLVGPDAEDAVQDTYLLARRAIGDLRDPASMEAWLRRICVNRCFRAHRRQGILRRVVGLLTPPTATPSLDLRELIEQLPPRQRTILVLHYGHGYSLVEIGEMLGISHDNARAIVSRARRRLAAAWLEADR